MTLLQWKVVSLLRCNLPTPSRNSPGASADAIWAVTDTWLESEIWSCTLMNVVYRRAADGPNPPTWRDLFPRTQMRPAGVFPQRPIGSARPLCRRLAPVACLLYRCLLTAFLNASNCASLNIFTFSDHTSLFGSLLVLLLFVAISWPCRSLFNDALCDPNYYA